MHVEMSVEGQKLSDRLRGATRELHTGAERAGIMPSIIAGRVERATYAALLGALAQVYTALETELERHARHPVLSLICLPEVFRAGRAIDDLNHLGEADWLRLLQPTPAVAEWTARIRSVSQGRRPELLVGHAYTRYMGDLSGGQILKGILAHTLDLTDGRGLAFFDFPAVSDIKAYKESYRARLDRMPLGEAALADVAQEAARAFRLNIALLEALA